MLLPEYDFFQTVQTWLMIDQVCLVQSVAKLPILFFQIFRVVIQTDTEIEPLYIFTAFEDIAAVLMLHIVLSTPPKI